MAENEALYLQQCREQNICPACQKPIISKVGSGQNKDGVFCSMDCYAGWHEGALRKRHEERMKKAKTDE